MKSKNISILFFILVFTGVALLVSTPARADWNRGCTDPPVWGTPECVIVPTSADPNVLPEDEEYTIKAFVACRQRGDPTDTPYDCSNADSEEIPVVLTGAGANWPIQDVPNNRTIFRYITGPTHPGTNISGQSYTVFDWPVIPPGGDPPGAQASLDEVWADCQASIPANRIAWKLNRIANKHRDGIIDIYMPLGTGVDETCGQVFIKWGGQCDGDTIWVAAGALGPVTETLTFCDGRLVITRDQCTGEPETVKIGGTDARPCEPQICFDPSPTPDPASCLDLVALGKEAGPASTGCVLDCEPIIYGYGGQYWCEPED